MNGPIGPNELSELVVKSQSGSRDAQERLIRAVQDQVFFHCRKILQNQDDAMDAAQDILISMLKSLKKLREPAAFHGWLAQITCRVCWKYAARRSRDRKFTPQFADVPDFASLEDDDAQSMPEQAADTEETRRIVRELVDGLPPDQAMCVLLYYYDEMPVKDIAGVLSVSEGTVKSRLYYARQNLKKGLEKYSDVPFYSPVPFLRYFLRKEASGLTAAAAKSMADAVLAAAAAVTVPKAAIAAAVAGIALAGALGAGVLPGRNIADAPYSPPDAKPPVIIQETVQAPDAPAPARPVPAAPAPAPDGPAPAPRIQIQRLTVSEPVPAPVPIAVPVIPVPPETEISEIPVIPEIPEIPEQAPEQMPDTVLIVVNNNDTPAVPAPEPEPEPEPVPEPETPSQPSPPASSPDTQDTYEPYEPYEPYDPYEPYEPLEPEPEPEPEEPTVISQELAEFGYNSGYGYTYRFIREWDGDLPENLVFSSSDPSVISIDDEGWFTTLVPGQATLTAEDPDNPDVRYSLTMDVQDRFNWEYELKDVAVQEGKTERGGITFQIVQAWSELLSVVWGSDDESVATVRTAPYSATCYVSGVAPGETDITGLATFTVETVDDVREMQDKISFHVTVTAPEPEPEPDDAPDDAPDEKTESDSTPDTPEMPDTPEETVPAPDDTPDSEEEARVDCPVDEMPADGNQENLENQNDDLMAE